MQWTSLGEIEFIHVCVIVFLLIRKIANHFTEEVGTVGVVCLTGSSRHSPNHSHVPSPSGIHQEAFPLQDLPASLSEGAFPPQASALPEAGLARGLGIGLTHNKQGMLVAVVLAFSCSLTLARNRALEGLNPEIPGNSARDSSTEEFWTDGR